MRMFKITVNGTTFHEPANGRTPEELHHHLTVVEGMRNVKVAEWIRRGARTPITQRESTDED